MNNEIQKVGLVAFNELAESHEAHVRQIAKLEKEITNLKRKLTRTKNETTSNNKRY